MKIQLIDHAAEYAELIDRIAEIDGAIFASNQWGRDSLAESAANDYDFLTAAISDDDGRAVGFGLLRCFDDAEVIRIAVDPGMRRRGIGKLILDEMIAQAKSRGVQDIFLEVRSSNTAAIELYKGAGFTAEGIRKGYYSEPKEDALIMRFKC